MLVQPDDRWPERRVTFNVRASSTRGRFVLSACNVGVPATGVTTTSSAFEVSFRYLVIDLP